MIRTVVLDFTLVILGLFELLGFSTEWPGRMLMADAAELKLPAGARVERFDFEQKGLVQQTGWLDESSF